MSEYSKNEISVQSENGVTIFSMQEIKTYPVNTIEISEDIEKKNYLNDFPYIIKRTKYCKKYSFDSVV